MLNYNIQPSEFEDLTGIIKQVMHQARNKFPYESGESEVRQGEGLVGKNCFYGS